MALTFGKLAILVGAGVVGSVLAKEGSLLGVSDILSGAFKLPDPDINAGIETMKAEVASMLNEVENQYTRIDRMDGKQNTMNKGVLSLCNYASHVNELSLELPPSSSSNGNRTPKSASGNQSSSSCRLLLRRKLPCINPASFLTTAHSLSNGVLQQGLLKH